MWHLGFLQHSVLHMQQQYEADDHGRGTRSATVPLHSQGVRLPPLLRVLTQKLHSQADKLEAGGVSSARRGRGRGRGQASALQRYLSSRELQHMFLSASQNDRHGTTLHSHSIFIFSHPPSFNLIHGTRLHTTAQLASTTQFWSIPLRLVTSHSLTLVQIPAPASPYRSGPPDTSAALLPFVHVRIAV